MTAAHWSKDMSSAPRGIVFPPSDEWDVAAYDVDECVSGYRDYRAGDEPPGNNRTAAYRWGWANAKRDCSIENDGFDWIRRAFIRLERASRIAASAAANNLGALAD